MAHPSWNLKIGEEAVLKKFVDWQIDAVEAIHGKRTKQETRVSIRYFSNLAKKYHLLITGGSDFHADKENEPGNDLGLLDWKIKIPCEILERLKDLKTAKKNETGRPTLKSAKP